MLAFIIGVVLFALGIGLAVALHEAGHMLTAKAFGMRVRRYYIGFGPKIFSFRRGETEYGLKAIPAGGFCDIAGMTAMDEVTEQEAPRAMWRYPVWKRFVVLVSGSVTHFILGFVVLYLLALTMGLPNNANKPVVGSLTCAANETISGTGANTQIGTPCKATDPMPAKAAGLLAGDEIVSVNGQPTPTSDAVTATVQKLHGPAQFVVNRNGQRLTLTVNVVTARRVPATDTTAPYRLEPLGAMGVAMAPYLHYDAVSAFGGATGYTGQIFVGVWQGLKQLPNKIPSLLKAIAGQPRDPNSPVSVIGASRLGGQAVENGLWSVFWLLFVVLQFFVGVFNLLPLLPLDGGHIAVAFYERVRDWLRRLAGRPAGGPVDYTKLAPLTMLVVIVGGAVMLLTVTADIVNPVPFP